MDKLLGPKKEVKEHLLFLDSAVVQSQSSPKFLHRIGESVLGSAKTF